MTWLVDYRNQIENTCTYATFIAVAVAAKCHTVLLVSTASLHSGKKLDATKPLVITSKLISAKIYSIMYHVNVAQIRI